MYDPEQHQEILNERKWGRVPDEDRQVADAIRRTSQRVCEACPKFDAFPDGSNANKQPGKCTRYQDGEKNLTGEFDDMGTCEVVGQVEEEKLRRKNGGKRDVYVIGSNEHPRGINMPPLVSLMADGASRAVQSAERGHHLQVVCDPVPAWCGASNDSLTKIARRVRERFIHNAPILEAVVVGDLRPNDADNNSLVVEMATLAAKIGVPHVYTYSKGSDCNADGVTNIRAGNEGFPHQVAIEHALGQDLKLT